MKTLIAIFFLLFAFNSYSGTSYAPFNETNRVPFHGNIGATPYLLNTWNWQHAADTNQLHVYDTNNVYLPQFDEANGTANIRLLDAWEITPNANGIKVGVIDSNADNNHRDLVVDVIEQIASPDIHVYDVTNYVPGIVAEVDYLASVTLAISKAVADGCQVVNMSFGYTSSKAPTNVLKAIYANPHVLFVVAALNGNGPQDTARDWLPNTGYSNVICVNSFSKSGEIFESGWGTNTVFISAPGRRVLSCGKSVTGTSFATPHVTATVALLYKTYPLIRPWQVKVQLAAGATKTEHWNDKNMVGGMLNVYGALYPLRFVLGTKVVKNSANELGLVWQHTLGIGTGGYSIYTTTNLSDQLPWQWICSTTSNGMVLGRNTQTSGYREIDNVRQFYYVLPAE